MRSLCLLIEFYQLIRREEAAQTIEARYAVKRPALDNRSWWSRKSRIGLQLHWILISTSHGWTNSVKHKSKLWLTESLTGSSKLKHSVELLCGITLKSKMLAVASCHHPDSLSLSISDSDSDSRAVKGIGALGEQGWESWRGLLVPRGMMELGRLCHSAVSETEPSTLSPFLQQCTGCSESLTQKPMLQLHTAQPAKRKIKFSWMG